tara:strand:- start:1010 stop:1387 length:378 start_codon:yes stop_codon:yes gene_type:complete
MKYTLPVHIEEAATGTDKFYYVLQERMTLDSVDIIANGEIANHGSNFVTFTVYGNDGATAAFVWSTETGKEGIIEDKTVKSMKDKSSGKATYNAGTIIYVDLASAASGKAVDVVLCLHFSQARKY